MNMRNIRGILRTGFAAVAFEWDLDRYGVWFTPYLLFTYSL